jgi:hypothetical protein
MALLTIYALLKSFRDDHIARIQRNAVRSWLRLDPKPVILVFGDEPGVAEHCAEFGLTRVTGPLEVIDGTVRLRDLAVKAEAVSDTPFYCYINADIILTSDLTKALSEIAPRFPRFLLGASPWNVRIREDLEFGAGWEAALERRAIAEDDLRSRVCSDFFLYPKGYLAKAPELLIGRVYVDNGMMWWVRHRRDPLIDGTSGILTVHQHHRYGHLGDMADRQHETVGAAWNVKAIGGRNHIYSWASATDHYTKAGIRPFWMGRICRWSTHDKGSRASTFFMKLLWRPAAVLSRPLRKALGLIDPARVNARPASRAAKRQ